MLQLDFLFVEKKHVLRRKRNQKHLLLVQEQRNVLLIFTITEFNLQKKRTASTTPVLLGAGLVLLKVLLRTRKNYFVLERTTSHYKIPVLLYITKDYRALKALLCTTNHYVSAVPVLQSNASNPLIKKLPFCILQRTTRVVQLQYHIETSFTMRGRKKPPSNVTKYCSASHTKPHFQCVEQLKSNEKGLPGQLCILQSTTQVLHTTPVPH